MASVEEGEAEASDTSLVPVEVDGRAWSPLTSPVDDVRWLCPSEVEEGRRIPWPAEHGDQPVPVFSSVFSGVFSGELEVAGGS
jgi:hypothetical protein